MCIFCEMRISELFQISIELKLQPLFIYLFILISKLQPLFRVQLGVCHLFYTDKFLGLFPLVSLRPL
jgi:hypothetical protein